MKHLCSLIIGTAVAILGFGLALREFDSMLIIAVILLLAVSALSLFINRKFHNYLTVGLPVLGLICGNVYGAVKFKDYICIRFELYSVAIIVLFAVLTSHVISARNAKQNSLFGIRTSYCMEYPDVWDKTHRFYTVFGAAFLPPLLYLGVFSVGTGTARFIIACILFIIPPVVAAYYSNIYGGKYHKQAEIKEKAELKKQLSIEQGYNSRK